MIFQVDFQAGKPVYLQLADQIRYAAASGRLRPGEPLPSLRPLAEELRINRNTIAKAYAELESQGIIETLAGKPYDGKVGAGECVAAVSRLLFTHRHFIDDDRTGAEAGVDVGRRRGVRFVAGDSR